MSKFKPSRFNIFYNKEGSDSEIIAYNSFKNSLAIISKNEYEEYKQFECNDIDIKDKQLIDDLLDQGILINKEFDELDIIKSLSLRDRFSKSGLGLTIAPTMRCNFDCIYCYQKGKRDGQAMNIEIQEKLIEFIKSNLEESKELSVCWYGGEPLLAISVIEKLSEKIINICNDKNIKYNSSIVTNGYLLTEEVVNKLIKYKIKHLQITIDGPEDIHDERRFIINSKKQTFNTIISNIVKIFEITSDISIDIRINADKKNIDRVKEVIEIFKDKGILDKVYCYLGFIETNNGCYEEEACIDYENYINENKNFLNKINETNKNDHIDYPFHVTASCGADRVNSYVIAPDGKIFKCWSDIGIDKYSIGDLKNEKVDMNNTFAKYLLYDVTIDPNCKDCKIIPICMGGCFNHRINTGWNRCSKFNYDLEEILNKKVKSIEVK